MTDDAGTGDSRWSGRVRLRVAIGVAAMSLFASLPAVASATDYCVSPNVGCGGTNVADLETALDKADDAVDADRILLGAYDYVAPTTSGFDYSKSGAPVEIVGRGAGQTVLTAPPGASNVLRLFGGQGSSVHDVRIRMPDNMAYRTAGLSTDGLARRIDVVEASQQLNERRAVYLEHGGTLEDSSVMLAGLHTTAVWIDAGGGTVRGLSASAYTGVVSANGATIERSRLFGGAGVVGGRGVTTVNSTVIYVGGQPGVGLYANPIPGADATINADGTTILGSGHLSTRAALVTTTFGPTQNGDINLTNSIVSDGKLEVTAPGPGHARITVSYSDLDPSGNEINGAPNAAITLANTSNVGDPGFADRLLGDFHLVPSSPLIDAGDPNAPAGTDMDGKPRLVDGNGDGIARRDMGAFEYQSGLPAPSAPSPAPPAGDPGGGTAPADTQAPLIGGFRATPSLFALARASTPVATQVAHGTRFRYTLSEPARVKLVFRRALPGRRWGGRCVAPSPRLGHAKRCIRYGTVGALRRSGEKGANAIRFSGRLGKRALRAGRYRAVISATDTAGNRSSLRGAAFRIAPG